MDPTVDCIVLSFGFLQALFEHVGGDGGRGILKEVRETQNVQHFWLARTVPVRHELAFFSHACTVT